MSKPEILEKTSMNMAELKHQLSTIHKRDEELSFRGGRTMEYLQDSVFLNNKQAKELSGKLTKLEIARLKEEFVNKIIDVIPQTVDELKVLLQGYTITLTKEDMDKVMKTVKEYIPKKK